MAVLDYSKGRDLTNTKVLISHLCFIDVQYFNLIQLQFNNSMYAR
jgi:hypothetical protein